MIGLVLNVLTPVIVSALSKCENPSDWTHFVVDTVVVSSFKGII